MMKVKAGAFYGAISDLRRFESMVEFVNTIPTDIPLSDKHRDALKRWGADLDCELEALGAVASQRYLRLLIGDLEKEGLSYDRFRERFGPLDRLLKSELSDTCIYALDEKEQRTLGGQPLFGADVERAFAGSATEDIAEAGTCLAFGLYTAAVFHLMRAMEAAVQKLTTSLGIPNPDREWGKLLSDLHGAIEKMPKGDLRNSWSQAHANLYHVKQATRNEVMHPKQTYTEQQARDVYEAARVFMGHLAVLVT